ncbi:MAG: hypothetical protein HYR84_13470, partial [Planctomycetes bacterium]|nr:hypothetical protein [Planctomycetota bacterium]
INGIGMLGEGSQHSSVAYAAHLGGFFVGAALIKFFAIGMEKEPEIKMWPDEARSESGPPGS